MTGIQFITDAKGRKTAAIINLKKAQSPVGGHPGRVGLPLAAE